MGKHDEFYIGYEPKAPKRIARRIRLTSGALLLLAVGTAATLVLSQQAFDFGIFEFGKQREFKGVVVEKPYPMLLVEPGSPTDGAPIVTALDLVAFGKWGAGAAVAGLDGRAVRVLGTLVYNEQRAMIEVATDGIEPLTDDARLPAWSAQREVSLGRHKLVGEIVDSKCYLGVMKPGRSKPHKACAIRCISGGIPPVLRVTSADDTVAYYRLVDIQGNAVNDRVLSMIAEPVEIEGDVRRTGERMTLIADPSSYRRLTGTHKGTL